MVGEYVCGHAEVCGELSRVYHFHRERVTFQSTLTSNICEQVVGADLMELPKTQRDSRYVQDYLTKWPLVYPLSDHKTEPIPRILIDVIPFFGVPEARTCCHI